MKQRYYKHRLHTQLQQTPRTLGALWRWSIRQMQQAHLAFGHGAACAEDEAAWLMLHTLQAPLDLDLRVYDDHAIPAIQARKVQTMVHRRCRFRLPIAYLTQQAWLYGHAFYVDQRVIVPRSPIGELLVTGALNPWQPDCNPLRVLDLCTGNGSLAILAALTWKTAHITATDISEEALQVAEINVKHHQLADRITLVMADGIPPPSPHPPSSLIDTSIPDQWDIVLCNPPYVTTQSMAQRPDEYRHEPDLALHGGHDGMALIRSWLPQLSQRVAKGGMVVLEVGHERSHFEALLSEPEQAWALHHDFLWLMTSAGEDHVVMWRF